ncbi:MAG: hypothetical protein HUJ28_12925 [Chromatiales bacterium]|nr:hypothetical protein [Chromatiales bacterium]
MRKFAIRVGMVVFWNDWFWKVDRKLIDAWRLNRLGDNSVSIVDLRHFGDLLGRGEIVVISEQMNSPLLSLSRDGLMALAKQLKYAHLESEMDGISAKAIGAAPFSRSRR